MSNSENAKREVSEGLNEIIFETMGFQVDENQKFINLGMDSLNIIDLKNKIEWKYNVDLKMNQFVDMTVKDIIAFVECGINMNAEKNIEKSIISYEDSFPLNELKDWIGSNNECEFSNVLMEDDLKQYTNLSKWTIKDLNMLENISNKNYKNEIKKNEINNKKILLTGSTGFLGVHLLKELLTDMNNEIYCLIRSNSIENAWNKLQDTFAKWKLDFSEEQLIHIIPVIGNLEQDKLGLSEEVYDELSGNICEVIHAAALVNWLLPFDKLKKVNVDGTHRIIAFCVNDKVKPLCYISSLSVFPNEGEVYCEITPIDNGAALYGGYAGSKWVAEMLVLEAQKAGLPVTIFRPSIITGSSDGTFNSSSFLENCIKSFMQLECAPNTDTYVDAVTVDYVSKAIVHIIKNRKSLNKIFHLSNPNPIKLSEMVNWMKECGCYVEVNPYNKWKRKLFTSEKFINNSLFSFRNFIFNLKEDQTKMGIYYCDNTLEFLKNTNIECPPVNQLLATYFNYFDKAKICS